jgi:superfamily II DNA or RNA helicase
VMERLALNTPITEPVALILGCNSWDDFTNALRPLSRKQKGDAFEWLTRFFLLTHPTMQATYAFSDVWLYKYVPGDVRGYLGLPPKENGADLFGKTADGEFVAIQCKFKSRRRDSLSRDDVGKTVNFVEDECENVDQILMCAPCERESGILERYGKKRTPITYLLNTHWWDLGPTQFERIHAYIWAKAIKPQPYTRRSHQTVAIDRATTFFRKRSNTRGKLIMPCGTGKSLTAYWIANDLGSKNIFVVVPSLMLIKQTMQAWARESVADGLKMRFCAVCSDEKSREIEQDDLALRLEDLGVWVPRTDAEFSLWLKRNYRHRKVVFVTYQSGRRLINSTRELDLVWDLGIFDEAHRTAGYKGKYFALLLSEQNIRVKKRLFMTATERRAYARGYVSMEDQDVYGPEVFRLSFRQAVDKYDALCPYKIISIDVTDEEIDELVENDVVVQPTDSPLDKEAEARGLAAGVALAKLMADGKSKHAISFHSRIVRAEAWAKQQMKLAKHLYPKQRLKANYVKGSMGRADWEERLRLFETYAPTLLSNARVLNEGVDLPTADCVVFVDPKDSKIDIVQAVGRAMREAKNLGKDIAYVLLPTRLVRGDDGRLIPISDTYDLTVDLLQSLASNDETIVEYYEEFLNEGSSAKESPLEFSPKTAKLIDLEEFQKEITAVIWEKIRLLQPLTEAQILKWVDRHVELNDGVFPSSTGGQILNLSNETWRNVNAALRGGMRGLPGGSSLAQLLEQERGVRNIANMPRLTIKKILEYADAHFERTEEWPTRSSGGVLESPGETWKSINKALTRSGRGLRTKYKSLEILLADKRGVRGYHSGKKLTVQKIIKYAKLHEKQTKQFPNSVSEWVLEGIDETWTGIDGALRRGGRGLAVNEGGLSGLLHDRGLKRKKHTPRSKKPRGMFPTKEEILDAAEEFKEKHPKKRWPHLGSGEVKGMLETSWAMIDAALKRGDIENVPKCTLNKFLQIEKGKTTSSPLTEAQILVWCDEFFEQYEKYPAVQSNSLESMGENTFASINQALQSGNRGLPGGSSLPDLLRRERGRRDWKAAPRLTHKTIINKMVRFFELNQRWPVATDKEVPGDDQETWSAINAALVSGQRGLKTKDWSLAKIRPKAIRAARKLGVEGV